MSAAEDFFVSPEFAAWLQMQRARVEQALAGWVPATAPGALGVAMRYAVLGGGKRLRALLALAASEAVGGNAGAALRAACALELIHAYSLVHDDMPCMDGDVLRRGQPTVHVKFGQAQALLAGDALQTLAFELLTPDEEAGMDGAMQAQLVSLLARAAGALGMAGGQAVDLASVGQQLSEPQLRAMHALKTGALLRAAPLMGAACAPQVPAQVLAALGAYGDAIGLAFQVIDDVLDVTGSDAALGKTAGKDAAAGKPTYVSLLGLEAARALATELHAKALVALSSSGLTDTRLLAALAAVMVRRDH